MILFAEWRNHANLSRSVRRSIIAVDRRLRSLEDFIHLCKRAKLKAGWVGSRIVVHEGRPERVAAVNLLLGFRGELEPGEDDNDR